ncbi:MAG: DUF3010 family protein [Bacteroidia bacterium]
MKTVGITLESDAAILAVLELDDTGSYTLLNESTKVKLQDCHNNEQVRQFKDEIDANLDIIDPDRISILVRNPNGRGRMAPSPKSFKLEGLIQLNQSYNVGFVWPQTLNAFIGHTPCPLNADKKYRQKALELAFYLTH